MSTKKDAAMHSLEAFSLYEASQKLRAAANALSGIDDEAAAQVRKITSRIDARRRRIMAQDTA
ncbi:hypothetical protein [Afipia felis]|uniref:hypothetical protein n=1 Tax=Afipia felis TaxID=1035 RepID=UPI0011C03870|nr:hypothetical protein [Afipia felis]